MESRRQILLLLSTARAGSQFTVVGLREDTCTSLHLLFSNCIHLDVRLRGWPRVNNPRVLANLAIFTNWCEKCLSHKSIGWLNQSLLLLNHSGLEILLLVCEKGGVRHDFTTLLILRLALVVVVRSWQQSSHLVGAIGRVLI